MPQHTLTTAEEFPHLRLWQQEALELYRVLNKRNFTVTATPGAGKTTFALTLAKKLLSVGAVTQIIVIVPTDHLRTQWADASIESDIYLDPSLGNHVVGVSDDFTGYVATYAQVASAPVMHHRRAASESTLVIFDEIHHAGDGLSWGDALVHAFSPAVRRLSLTGTPFRSGDSRIPFIEYEGDDDVISKSDYTYGYGEALANNVVRPVTFAAYNSDSEWMDSTGESYSSNLTDATSDEIERKALRTALDPEGQWVKHVFRAAHDRLLQIRDSGMPDAGGMVLASDQENAKAYAAILRTITKQPVALVVSDDNKADKKLDAFKDDKDALWLVAVRMVSEGVDIPRLAVGVWATNYRTPLFFAQAVGRFVRARNRHEVATIFLPAVRSLLSLAATMEEKRRHIIGQKDDKDILGELEAEMAKANEEERALNSHVSVSSEAAFEHVLFNGKALDGVALELDDDQAEYMGLLPEVLNPNQIAALLRERDVEMKASNSEASSVTGETVSKAREQANLHRRIRETRKNINRLVSRIALSKGVGHAHVHKLAQNAVSGPPTSVATLAILEEREEWLSKNV